MRSRTVRLGRWARSRGARGPRVPFLPPAVERSVVPERRALILASGAGHGALAAARGLVASGWTVGVGVPEAHARTTLARSRSVARRHEVPLPVAGISDTVRAVEQAIREGGYGVVWAAGDDWLGLLSHVRDRLPAHVAHPPEHVVGRSLDKLGILTLGAQVGFAVPRTAEVSAAALRDWEGPAVIKAREHWSPQRQGPRLEARVLDPGEEMSRLASEIEAAGSTALVQEVVEGDLLGIVGLVVGGRLVQVSQQRALRLWPYPAGVTARGVTERPDPTLVARAERFLELLGWEGVVQLEFVDPWDDGEPMLIDVNGRIYSSLALARRAGLRLVEDWSAHLVEGIEVPIRRASVGTRYQWLEGDLRGGVAQQPARRLAAVWDTLGWSRGAVGPVWDPQDPAAALHEFVTLAQRVVHKARR